MNAPLQLKMTMTPQAHRNQYLFSDHYLDNLLRQDSRWDAAMAEAEAFLEWLQRLYAQEQQQLPKYNENQLEDHWFKFILGELGHVFERQASVPGLNDGVKRPDYVFFPDDAARQAAVGAQKTEEYTADALAVGEVKRWDVPLSKKQKGGGASFEAQNPSWQIDYYLRATGLEWGILSNGRLWRLVHKDTSQRLSIYYEVDLVDLLHRGDAGAMRYFTLFFRQGAFRPDAQGRVLLPDALAASMAYAVAVEEDLEANVYRALEQLMQGFLDLPANGLGAGDLRRIYENSLYLLYRLLFILYGESRGLLPLNNDSYRDNYSLDHIKQEIAERKTPLAPMTTIYWGRLKQLFQIINGDNVELNRHLGVHRYNGRLFDPEQHPFLEQYAVGDRALVEAVDLLSRRTTEAGREFVDYRTLGVRHLGSIYEGLLEYQPRYSTEPMVAVRDGKSERWVAEADLERPLGSRKTPRVVRRDAGQVYLETDRGERKATGSYYTPQYIVEYIVHNTLGPLVEEATERVKERAKEVKGKVARAAVAQSLRWDSGQALVDEVLNLKVLDPAMGSGHFLVEATEYLALALATDPYVETEAEVSVEEDLLYWKRRVVERCIYGVDKNPLAVELAKLSLWLVTVAADKPLSFLDHHLQCGDSLIGARVADMGSVPSVMLNKKVLRELKARYDAGVRQANLFEIRLVEKLPVVMGRILEITEVESDSYDTVRAKEATDQAVRQLKAPFQAVANLWTSAYFGNEFIAGEYDEALTQIGQPDALLALAAVQRAQTIADVRRFFHWELAFPEVFYDRHGRRLGKQAGFDVVIGNPPWIDAWTESSMEQEQRETTFSIWNHRVQLDAHWDMYIVFIHQALGLLRASGRQSFVLPSPFATEQYAEPVRHHILENYTVDFFVDFGIRTIFPGVSRKVIIEGVRNVSPSPESQVAVHNPESVIDRSAIISHFAPQRMWLGNPRRLFRADARESYASILAKIEWIMEPTGNYFYVNYGAQISSKKKGDFKKSKLLNYQRQGNAKACLEGKDVSRYETTWRELWLDYQPDIMYGPRAPELFENDKLLVSKTTGQGFRLLATLDSEHFYCDQRIVIVIGYGVLEGTSLQREFQGYERADEPVSLAYACALYSSTLLSWYFYLRLATGNLQGEYSDVVPSSVRALPIRHIEFTTPADEREHLVKEAKAKARQAVKALTTSGAIGSDAPLDQAILSEAALLVLEFVRERLAAKPEQSDVVHDLLAHLAEQMIVMHKQKRTAVEAFWLDLEGVTEAAAFEVLRNKGKQERTLWKKAEVCRPFVREESHSTRRLDESLGWNEEPFKAFVKILVGKVQGLSDLVGVYRAHSPACRKLVSRIEATDWLIDQIVYQLYGLTEEEIAIVEGG